MSLQLQGFQHQQAAEQKSGAPLSSVPGREPATPQLSDSSSCPASARIAEEPSLAPPKTGTHVSVGTQSSELAAAPQLEAPMLGAPGRITGGTASQDRQAGSDAGIGWTPSALQAPLSPFASLQTTDEQMAAAIDEAPLLRSISCASTTDDSSSQLLGNMSMDTAAAEGAALSSGTPAQSARGSRQLPEAPASSPAPTHPPPSSGAAAMAAEASAEHSASGAEAARTRDFLRPESLPGEEASSPERRRLERIDTAYARRQAAAADAAVAAVDRSWPGGSEPQVVDRTAANVPHGRSEVESSPAVVTEQRGAAPSAQALLQPGTAAIAIPGTSTPVANGSGFTQVGLCALMILHASDTCMSYIEYHE